MTNKGILGANGVHSYWDIDTNTQLTGTYEEKTGELVVLGSGVVYETTPSNLTKLSARPSDGKANRLGEEELNQKTSGGRETGGFIGGIPEGTETATVEAQALPIKYWIIANDAEEPFPQSIRDNGNSLKNGDIIELLSIDEVNGFRYTSENAVVTDAANAKVIISYRGTK